MKRILRLLPVLVAAILPFGQARAQSANQNQATGSNSMKRNYPGGRDDTDLTVQPRKRITKKESDQDENFEDESSDFDSTGSSGDFGE